MPHPSKILDNSWLSTHQGNTSRMSHLPQILEDWIKAANGQPSQPQSKWHTGILELWRRLRGTNSCEIMERKRIYVSKRIHIRVHMFGHKSHTPRMRN